MVPLPRKQQCLNTSCRRLSFSFCILIMDNQLIGKDIRSGQGTHHYLNRGCGIFQTKIRIFHESPNQTS
ncbi:unnamed protein product, partial [Nesidiocoris tenuis]